MHDFRVGTRNATSALSVLEVWIPEIVVKPLIRTSTAKVSPKSGFYLE
jgi:hypothetical protein